MIPSWVFGAASGGLIVAITVDRSWPATSRTKAIVRFALTLVLGASIWPMALFLSFVWIVTGIYIWAKS